MTGVRRAKCSCCGSCPDGCHVCITTTGNYDSGACIKTKTPEAYDLSPYNCGTKDFNFSFTLGNNGIGGGCTLSNANIGFSETPSYSGSDPDCSLYKAENFSWSINVSEDWSFDGLNFDYENNGWKKFEMDGGPDDCDVYLYKLGQTSVSNCCDLTGASNPSCDDCNFSSFNVSAWAVGINTESQLNPRLELVEITDTNDYTAFTITYSGDSDYVTVATADSSITFTWIGGTYDGETCTIPVINEAPIPALCINSMNKGISASNVADDFVGCCHSLKTSSTNIASGASTNIEYNKTENLFYYRFAFEYVTIAHLGTGATTAANFEDVWDGTNNCSTPVLITDFETLRFMQWDTSAQPLDMCQCVSDLPKDSYYCANDSTMVRVAYSSGSDCIVSSPINPCSGSCNCFTDNESFVWS